MQNRRGEAGAMDDMISVRTEETHIRKVSDWGSIRITVENIPNELKGIHLTIQFPKLINKPTSSLPLPSLTTTSPNFFHTSFPKSGSSTQNSSNSSPNGPKSSYPAAAYTPAFQTITELLSTRSPHASHLSLKHPQCPVPCSSQINCAMGSRLLQAQHLKCVSKVYTMQPVQFLEPRCRLRWLWEQKEQEDRSGGVGVRGLRREQTPQW